MPPESNLSELLKALNPVRNEGEYVFVTLSDDLLIPEDGIVAVFKEAEGRTIILRREAADQAGLSYDFVAAWITLTVHSSLDAVGLTAAISTELTNHSISCNIVAAYYHDHLFIPFRDAERALQVLENLSASA